MSAGSISPPRVSSPLTLGKCAGLSSVGPQQQLAVCRELARGVGDMTQQVKCLWCKLEDLGSDPQHSPKKPGMVVWFWDPDPGREEVGCCSLVSQPSQISKPWFQ